jgi:hypothetical protein
MHKNARIVHKYAEAVKSLPVMNVMEVMRGQSSLLLGEKG